MQEHLMTKIAQYVCFFHPERLNLVEQNQLGRKKILLRPCMVTLLAAVNDLYILQT